MGCCIAIKARNQINKHKKDERFQVTTDSGTKERLQPTNG